MRYNNHKYHNDAKQESFSDGSYCSETNASERSVFPVAENVKIERNDSENKWKMYCLQKYLSVNGDCWIYRQHSHLESTEYKLIQKYRAEIVTEVFDLIVLQADLRVMLLMAALVHFFYSVDLIKRHSVVMNRSLRCSCASWERFTQFVLTVSSFIHNRILFVMNI